MTLRQRFSKDPLKVVRQLDAFTKVPGECQQSTRIGGTRKQNTIYTIFPKHPSHIFIKRKLVYFLFSFDH